ncbi:MAG: cytochrome b/b6 domain-containing protein [Proteobacteria bacterium]|nr:cytochrome b/b6 domain-containing protein [Pseudomonadota bacterium]
MSPASPVTRYHLVLVTLHWLLAVLICIALGMGMFSLSATPNSSPAKVDALKGHMVAGITILLLMTVRLVVRAVTAHPPPAQTGMAWADRLGPLAHGALYLGVFAMAGSGIAMAVGAGLPQIVFQGVGQLPADFHHLPARAVHGLVASLLVLLIVLHVAAALYHQWVRRDHLLARMGFGPRR